MFPLAQSRASLSAMKLAIMPPLVSVPPASSGYPTRSASHLTTLCSMATAAGPIDHAPGFWLIAEATKSARTPAGRGLGVMSPKYPG